MNVLKTAIFRQPFVVCFFGESHDILFLKRKGEERGIPIKKVSNKKGLGLVGLIVAALLGIVIFLGSTKVVMAILKSRQTTRIFADFDQVRLNFHNLLRGGALCGGAFQNAGGQPISFNPGGTTAVNRVVVGANVLVVLNQASGRITPTTIEIIDSTLLRRPNFDSDGDGVPNNGIDLYFIELRVEASVQDSQTVFRFEPRPQFGLAVDGSNKIVGCFIQPPV